MNDRTASWSRKRAADERKIKKSEHCSWGKSLYLLSWENNTATSLFQWLVTCSTTKKAPGQILWEYTGHGLLRYEHFILKCCTTKTWSRKSGFTLWWWEVGERGGKGKASEGKTLWRPTWLPFPFSFSLCLCVQWERTSLSSPARQILFKPSLMYCSCSHLG